jgi:putative ABC transport system permease protein
MSTLGAGGPAIGLRRVLASLLRQRRRLVLATVAVALGVGYLAGALTLLDRVGAGLDDLAAAGAERADLVVEGDVAYESALEQTRRLVPSSIAAEVASVPGVAAVAPRVESVTVLLDPSGEPVVAPGLSEQPQGANWPDDPQMSPYEFVGEGRPPQGPDEVVIDERSAREAGVGVGDRIVAVSAASPASFEVTGVVTVGGADLPAGSSLALFETERARELFDLPTNDNRLAVRLEPGADAEAVRAAIASILPTGAEVVDGATGARHRQESLTRSFALVRALIVGFAGLALVVAMVTVANSLTLLYTERRRTFAGFRLVGARRGQLLAAAVAEAGLLAAVASLAGLPLGLVLGRVIEWVLGALGTAVPVAGSPVSPGALVAAALIGVVATMLAAVVPAWRACSVAPIEAVADTPAPVGEPALQRVLNAAIVAFGIGVLLMGLMVLADVSASVAVLVGGGVAGVWLLAAVLPWVLSLAVAGGILLVPTRPPALRRIAARDAVRNRARTAATTGALLLATAVVVGLAVLLSSFASAVDGDVRRLVVADLVVDSGTFTRGGLPSDLLDELAAVEGVEAVSGWQVGRVWFSDVPMRVTGIDGAELGSVLAPDWVGRGPDRLTDTQVALAAPVADTLGVGVGDPIEVLFTSGGVEQMDVAGIYGAGSVLLGDAVMDRSVLTRQVPASVDIAALVATGGPDAEGRVRAVVDAYGVPSVLEPAEFVDTRSQLLRGFERVIQWMLLFTLLQALVGVVNTLLLSVGERRREFGLLRVSGASRRQLHRLVLVEGVSFAVVGTALGVLLGVGGAWAAVRALARFGLSGLDVPVLVVALTATAATALGVLAAVVPARWAAAVPPLDAIADSGATFGAPRAAVDHRVAPATASEPSAPPVAPPGGPPPEPAPHGVPPTPPPYRGPIPAAAAARADEAVPAAEPVPVEEPVGFEEPAVVEVPVVADEEVPVTAAEPVEARTPDPAPPSEPAWVRPAPEPGSATAAGAPSSSPFGVRRPGRDGARAPRAGRAAPAGPTLDPATAIRLGAALERLEEDSVRDAGDLLEVLARALEPDEALQRLVQGWVRGTACVVAATDRRVVVVADRFPEPLVESLPRSRVRVSLFGPPGADHVSLAIVDRRRLLEVTGVRDRGEAAQLAGVGAPRRRSSYF